MGLKMLKVPEALQGWYDDAVQELAAQGPSPIELNDLRERLKEHLDEEGRRLFLDFDNLYGKHLVFHLDMGFSIGFQLGRHPELLLEG